MHHRGIRGSRPGAAAAVVALLGALLLVVAEFTPVYELVVGSPPTVQRSVRGGSNHGYALLLVAVLAPALGILAGRRVRAAALALLAVGAVALLVALAVDLPDTSGSGRLEQAVSVQETRARAGPGLYLELAGGALLVVAGALGLLIASSRRPASAA